MRSLHFTNSLTSPSCLHLPHRRHRKVNLLSPQFPPPKPKQRPAYNREDHLMPNQLHEPTNFLLLRSRCITYCYLGPCTVYRCHISFPLYICVQPTPDGLRRLCARKLEDISRRFRRVKHTVYGIGTLYKKSGHLIGIFPYSQSVRWIRLASIRTNCLRQSSCLAAFCP